MTNRTYEQTANDFRLWVEFVDTDATMTVPEFDAMSIAQKVQIQIDAFGPEAE